MASEVEIRDARAQEFDEAAAVLAAAYVQYGPDEDASDDLRREFAEYQRELVDVRSRMHDSLLIVALQDGRIVGTVTFYPPRGDQPVGEGWPAGWAGIRLLGVHPAARGRGIGRALTEECLRRARALGAPTMGLHTTTLMDVARVMYERMGFTRIPEYDFKVTDDFIVMAYRLDLDG